MLIFQDWPLILKGRAPACHSSPVNWPGCLGGKSVMYSLGSAACSLAASSANCAHVVGTGRLYFWKMSCRYHMPMGPVSCGMAKIEFPSSTWLQLYGTN